jgi:hypothetical protein
LSRRLVLVCRNRRQPSDRVAHGYVARVEHLLVEFLLLQICELLVEFVFVDAAGADALCYRFADLFADGVLFAEVFPVEAGVLAEL